MTESSESMGAEWMRGAYRDGEDPWLTHWRWAAIKEGSLIGDLRQLHSREAIAGVPTGKCRCGLPAPCPTAEIIGTYTVTLKNHCDCSGRRDGWCPRDGLRRPKP